jgi:hypothetical protein
MMIIIGIPFLVCIVGLVMYAFAKDPKVARVGELMFFAGLLVTLLAVSGGHLRIG